LEYAADAPPSGASFRTIWVSDFHLGARGCEAQRILAFLRETESETLYLVGDIVDGWALRRGWHWPQAHNDVVQKLLRKARKGTSVVYIPGNHDAFARQFVGLAFGDIPVEKSKVHTTADGRRLLVLHGDEFDGVVRFAPWLSKLGSRVYAATLAANSAVTSVRDRLGLEYWSLAGYLKQRAKKAVQYVAEFESAVARAASQYDADGVVCGHIHRPELRLIEGPGGSVLYANCGDWVESCSALVEHWDGRLEILRVTSRPAVAGDGAVYAPDSSALPRLAPVRDVPLRH
jgi:UDP-2,3-diacylglucosamine pyrophosphatase LpxH